MALAALMLTFALPRHTRLPVRLAAVLVALAALGAHLGGQAYARLHPGPPPGALCYVLIVVPQKTPSPQQRLETLARLVARGAISKVVAERAGRVK